MKQKASPVSQRKSAFDLEWERLANPKGIGGARLPMRKAEVIRVERVVRLAEKADKYAHATWKAAERLGEGVGESLVARARELKVATGGMLGEAVGKLGDLMRLPEPEAEEVGTALSKAMREWAAKRKAAKMDGGTEDADFRPAKWFTQTTKVPAARLRQAARRKTMKVRSETRNGVVVYSVKDARQWWVGDMGNA